LEKALVLLLLLLLLAEEKTCEKTLGCQSASPDVARIPAGYKAALSGVKRVAA